MLFKKHIVLIAFIAIAIISYIGFIKCSATIIASVAQPGDIMLIEKHYADLTNCTISFTQQSTMIGSMNGSISVGTNADISIQWRDHQDIIGDFTNRIYKDGNDGIWQRYQSNYTKYPSLIAVLNAAKATSRGVSYVVPVMLLGGKTLGDPSLWKPVLDNNRNTNECVLENKTNLVSFLITYDPKTYKIIKTSRKIKITLGIVDEETTYVEHKDN
jgi:hypothetical protein